MHGWVLVFVWETIRLSPLISRFCIVGSDRSAVTQAHFGIFYPF
jgi:hypothetical protein